MPYNQTCRGPGTLLDVYVVGKEAVAAAKAVSEYLRSADHRDLASIRADAAYEAAKRDDLILAQRLIEDDTHWWDDSEYAPIKPEHQTAEQVEWSKHVAWRLVNDAFRADSPIKRANLLNRSLALHQSEVVKTALMDTLEDGLGDPETIPDDRIKMYNQMLKVHFSEGVANDYHRWLLSQERYFEADDLEVEIRTRFGRAATVLEHGSGFPQVGIRLKRRYRVGALVGGGGVARVFAVRRVSDMRRFAAKIFSEHRFVFDEGMQLRFDREADALLRIASPHVMRLEERFTWNDRPVLILEYADRGSLYERLTPALPCSVDAVVSWLAQALEGLKALHENRLVHRDLSPRNIMFCKDDRLVIGDLGAVRGSDDLSLTGQADRLGSLLYISAQQREDPHRAVAADDVFALGQVFFHVVAGIPPHGATGRLNEHRPDFPSWLSAFIDRMRSFRREDRPMDAVAALREFNIRLSSESGGIRR